MTAPASAPATSIPPDVLAALTAALPSMIATAIQQLTPAPDTATHEAPPAPADTAPWTLSTAEPDTGEPSPAPDTAPEPSPEAPADPAPEPEPTADECADTAAPTPAPAAPDSPDAAAPAAAPSGPEPAPAPSVPEPVGKTAPGALRAAVARLLADHPGAAFTVTQVAKSLGGRSGGAVGNALEWLATHGFAERTGDKPRTYTATASIEAVMAATPTPAPAPRPARRRAAKTPSTDPGAAAPATPPEAEGTGDTGPAAAPAWDGRSPLPRPNGAAYHPRTLAETSDVAALRRLRAEGVAVLLYGPPGTGKTSLVEAAFPDAITICGDGDTQVSDLIGSYTQHPEGGYEFVYGPLVTAMQEGRVLFLDDATLIPPTVLAALYPGMDGRRQITVKEHKGESITAADGFYVIAGHNPNVHGAVLSDALSSRFSVQIEVSSDYDLARTLKIDSTAVRVARNLATRKSKGEIGWAPQLRELLAFHKIQTILGNDAAWSNLLGIAPAEDRDTVATVLKTALGRDVTHLALGKQL